MLYFLLSQALFSLRRWAPSPKFVASNKFVGISKDSSSNLYRRQWLGRWIFRSSLRRCSIEKMFLNILQNSQENTCARVSFLIKLETSGLQLYWKRDSGTGIFLWILQNFWEQLFFTEHLWTTVSAYKKI